MNKDRFAKIEKILKSSNSSGGGLLEVTKSKCSPIINFNNIVHGDVKRDFLVYVEYFPNENRYGFSVYEKNSEDKK
jgi:hypothetical protein